MNLKTLIPCAAREQSAQAQYRAQALPRAANRKSHYLLMKDRDEMALVSAYPTQPHSEFNRQHAFKALASAMIGNLDLGTRHNRQLGPCLRPLATEIP
ncbi:MAG: hypothetical protein BVN35_16935 [Proteobacteria bacterium ST_bin11]|nr:MAG: hypothetical protein BVN35_16935 [Proteobacteria bacterium ST_bin11]